MWLIALIFGIVALRQLKNNPEKYKKGSNALASIGLIFAIALIPLGIFISFFNLCNLPYTLIKR